MLYYFCIHNLFVHTESACERILIFSYTWPNVPPTKDNFFLLSQDLNPDLQEQKVVTLPSTFKCMYFIKYMCWSKHNIDSIRQPLETLWIEYM